jgi:DNA-binding NarL/FixJ family response regulator
MDRPARLLIVEDHAAVREAITAEFEREPDFEVVGQAACMSEARAIIATADLAIVDLGLPDGFGADLIPELQAVNPNALAIVLTAAYDVAILTLAIERGAAAALDKITHLGHIAPAVRRLVAGERLVPSE